MKTKNTYSQKLNLKLLKNERLENDAVSQNSEDKIFKMIISKRFVKQC